MMLINSGEMGRYTKEFEKTVEFRKGEICEGLVREFLEGEKYIVYTPRTKGAHAIDIMASKHRNGVEIIFADSKGKARRTMYPDTGIDIRHYHTYKEIQNRGRVFIFFVDETPCIEAVYGNWLSILDKNISVESKGIIYFKCNCMKHIRKIPTELAVELRTLSNNGRVCNYWGPSSSEDYALLKKLAG